MDWSMDQN